MGWRLCAAGLPVSAAPHVAASPVTVRRADLLRPCQAQLPQPPRPALARPSSLPPPGSRWTRPPAAATGCTARASELRGLRSRVPGTGRVLAFANQGNLSLPCHQVPAEEGEGRGAAFPVPPARLDLRGLRLPGNSRAAAGPGCARGLLGAGLECFGTTSLGKSVREGEAGAPWVVGRAWPGAGIRDAGRRAGSESPRPLV